MNTVQTNILELLRPSMTELYTFTTIRYYLKYQNLQKPTILTICIAPLLKQQAVVDTLWSDKYTLNPKPLIRGGHQTLYTQLQVQQS